MNLLENLFGGGQQGQQQDYQDFINRYQQGSPMEGYSGQEAMQRYQQVAPQMPAGDYQQAAEQMLSQMSPEQRMQFGQYVQQQAMQQGYQFPATQMPPEQYQNSGQLAQAMTQMHQQQPGLLGQLLGGGGSNGGSLGQMLDNPLAKMALAGIAAYGAKQMLANR
jgi:hypothetical protein